MLIDIFPFRNRGKALTTPCVRGVIKSVTVALKTAFVKSASHVSFVRSSPMKLTSLRLYVIDVDLELMPMQRQTALVIQSLQRTIIASSAGNVQYVAMIQKNLLILKLSNAINVRLVPMLTVC